jgi:hypothetical protein
MTAVTSRRHRSFPISRAGRAMISKYMDRFIDSIEWIAAIFVGVVALDVFITVLLRYFLDISVPDSYTLYDKVFSTRDSHLTTYDLHWPVWPFYLVAWIGDAAAVLLIAVRTYRLIFHPELIKKPASLSPVE